MKFMENGQRMELKSIDRLKIPDRNIEEALVILYRYTQHLLQHDIHSWSQVGRLRKSFS